MSLQTNPKAEDLDSRWPLPAIDMVYLREQPNGTWELRDFYGEVVLRTDNRSACFFTVANHNLIYALRH